jgi:hypothetical protein
MNSCSPHKTQHSNLYIFRFSPCHYMVQLITLTIIICLMITVIVSDVAQMHNKLIIANMYWIKLNENYTLHINGAQLSTILLFRVSIRWYIWHYMTWHYMTWHDMTWHDMTLHDMTWYDMIYYDIFNRNCFDTRWQQYITHLHKTIHIIQRKEISQQRMVTMRFM